MKRDENDSRIFSQARHGSGIRHRKGEWSATRNNRRLLLLLSLYDAGRPVESPRLRCGKGTILRLLVLHLHGDPVSSQAIAGLPFPLGRCRRFHTARSIERLLSAVAASGDCGIATGRKTRNAPHFRAESAGSAIPLLATGL